MRLLFAIALVVVFCSSVVAGDHHFDRHRHGHRYRHDHHDDEPRFRVGRALADEADNERLEKLADKLVERFVELLEHFSSQGGTGEASPAEAPQDPFARVVSGNCATCHNATNPQGGFVFTPEVAAHLGKPERWMAWGHVYEGKMPPTAPLKDEAVKLFRTWRDEPASESR